MYDMCDRSRAGRAKDDEVMVTYEDKGGKRVSPLSALSSVVANMKASNQQKLYVTKADHAACKKTVKDFLDKKHEQQQKKKAAKAKGAQQ